MTRRLPIFALFLVAASVAAAGYPTDVAKYIERREICEHFRQEPWPESATVDDKERREFIVSQFERYCKGTDKTIRELKRKYKSNRAVIEKLEQYESDIEGHPL